MRSILKRPIITEKTADYPEKDLNKYVFEVAMKADKGQIKKEIERVYEVEVQDVNTMIVRGKSRSRYSRRGVIKGKSPNYKKAIVTLVEGDEIDFYKHI
ncbi:MAG: 50S ribosomal protein L23 [Bacteroidota bacterium]